MYNVYDSLKDMKNPFKFNTVKVFYLKLFIHIISKIC